MQSTVSAALSSGLISKAEFSQILQQAVGRNFKASGEALRQIKTIGSWKREGFESYGQYCETVWGISEERADLLIQAWSLCKLLTMKGIDEKDLPQTEEVAVTLVRVEGTGDITEFWRRLIEHHNPRSIAVKTIYKSLRMGKATSAIVSNPKHPLNGETVEVFKRRGETVHAWTSVGEQVFVSPELRPCLPPTLLATA